MKFITIVITMLFAASVFANDAPKAGGETKEVCKDVVGKDGKTIKNKDGSAKQTCKKIKVHKKVEGTKVPEKK